MGKHRTAQQDAIFVAFMERHPIISKNYLKGDKQAAEAAWKRLSNELNSVGPPTKEACEWKRVWKDWKSCIRKKITNNRLEDSKDSGKGSLYQDTLTPLEDAVAVICDLYDMADTIVEARPKAQIAVSQCPSLQSLKTDNDEGTVTENEDEDEEDCSNPINIRSLGVKLEPRTTRKSSKRKLLEEDALEIEQDNEVPVLMDIAKELRNLNRQTRLNAQQTEANTEALLALGTQISDLMQQQLKERKRLNAIMEKFVLKMESTE
ncbi:uncharacterized protein LOC108041894 [Drosophila rhopaloa]|uniref:Regulatory protein zeste n=1 Tax=Drosophila rhopaloa TaxID=1041015 RepID=A0A6P4EBL4_DRORH|nr:uncharacterized protein LOC108041894 [Drosophila rhopaloa]XP_016975435.1 uncharacterized protein LOC108041894 [Drosophila rhopaloa]XP_016975437.1 uncharacterized protein LOC108041894 [Drosophila rhopaloa]